MKTRSQQYAATIFAQVETIRAAYPDENAKRDKAKRQKYGSLAHTLPVLIRTAGLTQALAFAETRTDAIQKETFLEHLALAVGLNRNQLLSRSREDDLSDYMRLTQQVLDALLWYKRFAQSVLKVDPSEDADALIDATQDDATLSDEGGAV